uniref:Ig-like domain-containing protein n=1 Tax=Scleropages formosus TaxID=113540 RepID=A0A8D0CLJ2_SCLFO
FPSEKVTLRCDLQGSSGQWDYRWSKDGQELPNRNGDTLTIHSAIQSDTGQYSCKGWYEIRTIFSDKSNDVSFNVSGSIPKPLLKQDTPSEEIYTGDKLTFNCTVEGFSTDWQYRWYKDTQHAVLSNIGSSSADGSSYTISSAALSHNGQYWCRAGRRTETFYTNYSDSLTLNVSVRPQATLTLETEWIEIFTTDHLTLRCDVPESSVEWNYTWYRDGNQLQENHTGWRYTVTSGTGLYTCRGNTTKRPFHTSASEPLTLDNILLKRKILVSISGCLIFGPFAVILACILLRMSRKSDENLKPASEELFTIGTLNSGKIIPINEEFHDLIHPWENGGKDAEKGDEALSVTSHLNLNYSNKEIDGQSPEKDEEVYSSPIKLCSFTGPSNN